MTNNGATQNNNVLRILEPHVPALPSLAVALDEKKRVTKLLVSERIEKIHRELKAQVRAVIERYLVRLKDSRLHFVGPPLEERTTEAEDAFKALVSGWVTLQDAIIAEWPAIVEEMQSFYTEYAEYVRFRRSTKLDEASVRRRYKVSWRWLNVELSEDLEALARTSVAAKVQGYMATMVDCLETMANALQRGDVARRPTIERVQEAFKEISTIVSHTEDSIEYAERIEQFGTLLEDLGQARESYDKKRKKEDALDELVLAVQAAREHAKPLLDAWTADFGSEDDELQVEQAASEQEAAGALLAAIEAPPESTTASLFAWM